MLASVVAAVASVVVAVNSSEAAVRASPITQTIHTVTASDADAFGVLGRKVPTPGLTPVTLVRTQMTMDPENKSYGPRFVHQTFALGGRSVARLDIFQGEHTAASGEANVVGGRRVIVDTKQMRDGSTNVTYSWVSSGLVLTLNINLVQGITRDIANQIVASIE